ncbi:MAG: iron complex outermembrane receptor protein, partial [Saprospiraceae bacterium]
MHLKIFTKISFFLPLYFLFTPFLSSQNITISGNVIDEYGDPLIGLSIILKEDQGKGTVTDYEGNYSITVPSESTTLLFQYIGYKEVEIVVGTQVKIDMVMKPDAEQLAEVQVTALGIKRQKREIGYSTESFDGVQLETSNAPNLVSALSGRSAGVQIVSPNGVDGGTTRITIRGNNNFSGNNQPLIVVDGVQMANEPGLTSVGRGKDWGSAINNINPADIESMNILKGPTASALYGSRGANGVVLITMKKGKKQKGVGIKYSLQHKTIQPYRYRDVQNVYGAGSPSTFLEPTFRIDENGDPAHPARAGLYPTDGPLGEPSSTSFGSYGSGVSWGPRMEGQMIRWWDGEMRPFSPQPDNIQQFFNNGNTTTHNLSFSGGGEMGTMRASLTRTDHNAIIPNSEFSQNTVNLGSSLNISKKLKADISLSYINYHRKNTPTLGDDHQNSFAKGVLYSFPRSYKGLEEELNFASDGSRFDLSSISPFQYSGANLWWNTYNNNTTLDRNKLIGGLSLSYDITDWLNITGRIGTDFTLNQFETKNTPTDLIGIEGGFYSTELGRDVVQNSDFLISAKKDKIFKSDFNVRFSVGAAKYERKLYGLRGQTNGWANPWLFALQNTEKGFLEFNAPPEFRSNKVINSVYSFLNLGYNDFLFLELTGRNDWSSTLPLDANSYFYPSASLSFIATEAFDLNLDFLNFWKIRGALANTATDDDPFLLEKTYRIGTFGGNQTATGPSTIPPVKLVPQRATSFEIGTTIGLWDERVNFDFTFYKINSFDQILNAPIPSSSGASNIKINTGEIENKGFEAILSLNLIRKKHFFLETGLNVSRNRNKIISLGDEGATEKIIADIWGLEGPAISVKEGDDFGTIVGFDYIYHENGQPILNESGTHYLRTTDRVPVGNASPKFTGGWTVRLGYKG